MNAGKLILAYLLTAVVFFAIDLTWLGVIAKNLYRKYLGGFLSDTVNWTAAFIFYALFIVGIFIFSILPAVEKNSFSHAVIMGGLFGFFTYATYDLTNLATLRGWPMAVSLVDLAWGAVVTAAATLVAFLVVRAMQP